MMTAEILHQNDSRDVAVSCSMRISVHLQHDIADGVQRALCFTSFQGRQFMSKHIYNSDHAADIGM